MSLQFSSVQQRKPIFRLNADFTPKLNKSFSTAELQAIRQLRVTLRHVLFANFFSQSNLLVSHCLPIAKYRAAENLSQRQPRVRSACRTISCRELRSAQQWGGGGENEETLCNSQHSPVHFVQNALNISLQTSSSCHNKFQFSTAPQGTQPCCGTCARVQKFCPIDPHLHCILEP